MNKTSKVYEILKDINSLEDKSLIRQARRSIVTAYHGMTKFAADDQHGIFEVFQAGILDYPTREQNLTERGGESVQREKLYGLSPEHKDIKIKLKEPAKSLSTRYSPDRVGIQARHISDGVYQDPYTNKIYDWNEGFTSEDGKVYPAGSVDLQSDLYPA